MQLSLEDLKKEIIIFLKEHEFKNWYSVSIEIQFPPFINKGYKGQWYFMDFNKKVIDYTFFLTDRFNLIFYKFIFEINQDNRYNTVQFLSKKDDYDEATISIYFNPEVEEEFQNNLPKSKKGKTLPWWKIESETIGLGNV